jgi:hypothetical protein
MRRGRVCCVRIRSVGACAKLRSTFATPSAGSALSGRANRGSDAPVAVGEAPGVAEAPGVEVRAAICSRTLASLIAEAVGAGASQARACKVLGLDVRTVQRWHKRPDGDDLRRGPKSR